MPDTTNAVLAEQIRTISRRMDEDRRVQAERHREIMTQVTAFVEELNLTKRELTALETIVQGIKEFVDGAGATIQQLAVDVAVAAQQHLQRAQAPQSPTTQPAEGDRSVSRYDMKYILGAFGAGITAALALLKLLGKI